MVNLQKGHPEFFNFFSKFIYLFLIVLLCVCSRDQNAIRLQRFSSLMNIKCFIMQMSGEGSSRGAKRRRETPARDPGQGARGPIARRQSTPKAPQPAQRIGRIRYAGTERLPPPGTYPVPEDRRRLRAHTLLDFEFGSAELAERERIARFRVFPHKKFDWGLVGRLDRCTYM